MYCTIECIQRFLDPFVASMKSYLSPMHTLDEMNGATHIVILYILYVADQKTHIMYRGPCFKVPTNRRTGTRQNISFPFIDSSSPSLPSDN